MTWRFRNSFTVVPGLRLNLSKSGLSASIGESPITMNVSPRGLLGTASIPKTGLSYRQTMPLGQNSPDPQPLQPSRQSLSGTSSGVQHVHSASTEKMTSTRLSEVKRLLQSAYQQHAETDAALKGARDEEREARGHFESWNQGFLLKRIRPERFKSLEEKANTEAARVTELEEQLQLSKISTHIDLDDQQAELFYQMRDRFAGLSEIAAIWDVKTKQATDRFHERTTAGQRIGRARVHFCLNDCDLILWNQKIPHLSNAKGGDLYLYPGFILYRAAKEAFSLIDYHDVRVELGLVQFHENEQVPSDSQVIGQVWIKSNKDGSRDKRFNGNYQIPVAHYGTLCLKSSEGLWEEFHLSNPEKMFLFFEALQVFVNSFEALPS